MTTDPMPYIDPETAKEMFKAASDYLEPITKSPRQELGGYLADKVKYWRASLQLKNLKKITQQIKEAGFEPKKLEMKVLFPYLDGISLEEDEQMQDRWADLITNYVDPNVNLSLTVYPEILRQLSTPEIIILQKLKIIAEQKKQAFITSQGDIPIETSIETVSVEIISNLVRLGLIEEVIIDTRKFNINYSGELITETNGIVGCGNFKISNFGKEFVKACTR